MDNSLQFVFMQSLPFIFVVGTIVASIILLTLFFKLLSLFSRKESTAILGVSLRGVLDDKTLVTIHPENGAALHDVRLVGFIEREAVKGDFPWELHGMLVLEQNDGRRVLIHA